MTNHSPDQPPADRVAEAIREFPFDDFGLDDVSYLLASSPDTQEWVPKLADAVLAVLPPPADRAAVYREAADRLAAMYSDDDPAVENLRQWADDENEQAEAEGGCAHCGSSDHSWDECRAYTAAVTDEAQQPEAVDDGPSTRAGLRDRITTAISKWHRDPEQPLYEQGADAVLAVLCREWPWLRAEAEDAAPTADQAAVLADDEGDELVCVDQCGSCDACGMEPFGTPAEGWRQAAHFLRRTARESGDRAGALHGARLIEAELRRLADEATTCHDSATAAGRNLAFTPPPADQAETERLRAERDSLGREAERLRTEWTAMRDRAERAEADRDWWRDRAYAVQARAERADRAAVLREAADIAYRIARRLNDQHHDERAHGAWDVENTLRAELRRLADETQQQPETRRCPSHEPLANIQCAKSNGHEGPHSDRAGRIWYPAPVEEECCGAEPPSSMTDENGREWTPGDCWCTLPPGHDGEHRCQPCTDRHGAPGWTDEPAAAPQQEPPVHGESVAHLAGLHDNEQEQSETETLRTPAAGRAPTELRVRVLREILNRLDGSRSDGDSATQDVGASMVRAVLADILADMQPAVDARQDGARQTDAETLAAIFEGFGRLLATSSRDWSEHPADAWLYAVICGWDCEQAEHDETCTHGAMEEMQERHGWYDDTVAKARRYRATVRALTAPAAGARQDGAQQ
jgi:hypothetical protein